MLSHENYVQSVRNRISAIAQEMLRSSLPYLEGALQLDSLLREADLEENDRDLTAFRMVASEIDHLPIGQVRSHWSEAALEKLEPDIERATEWARRTTIEECTSLSTRFGDR